MITYKTFTSENMIEFITNEKLFTEVVKILGFDRYNQKDLELKANLFKESLLNKEKFVFLAIQDKRVAGINSGFVKDKTFFIDYLYVHPFYQDKSIGTKLKLRGAAYLFSKKKIVDVTNIIINSPKVFSINKHIVNRQNKSSSREYIHKKIVGENASAFINSKNTFSITSKPKIKHGKK